MFLYLLISSDILFYLKVHIEFLYNLPRFLIFIYYYNEATVTSFSTTIKFR